MLTRTHNRMHTRVSPCGSTKGLALADQMRSLELCLLAQTKPAFKLRRPTIDSCPAFPFDGSTSPSPATAVASPLLTPAVRLCSDADAVPPIPHELSAGTGALPPAASCGDCEQTDVQVGGSAGAYDDQGYVYSLGPVVGMKAGEAGVSAGGPTATTATPPVKGDAEKVVASTARPGLSGRLSHLPTFARFGVAGEEGGDSQERAEIGERCPKSVQQQTQRLLLQAVDGFRYISVCAVATAVVPV